MDIDKLMRERNGSIRNRTQLVSKKGVSSSSDNISKSAQIPQNKRPVQSTKVPQAANIKDSAAVTVAKKSLNNVKSTPTSVKAPVVASSTSKKKPVSKKSRLVSNSNEIFEPVALDGLLVNQNGELLVNKNVPASASTKIPTALWDASKDEWLNKLGLHRKNDIKSLSNGRLAMALMIRDLDISKVQKDTLLSAYDSNDIMKRIVYYSESDDNSVTESLDEIKNQILDVKKRIVMHDANEKQHFGLVKRILSWLFMERIGIRVGNVTQKTPASDAVKYLNVDTVISMTNALDSISDDESLRQKTKNNGRY